MDRFGVRRHDAALVLVRKRGKSGVALRLPPHSKKERSRIGMECGDKAKGRGTALILVQKRGKSGVPPWSKSILDIAVEFR